MATVLEIGTALWALVARDRLQLSYHIYYECDITGTLDVCQCTMSCRLNVKKTIESHGNSSQREVHDTTVDITVQMSQLFRAYNTYYTFGEKITNFVTNFIMDMNRSEVSKV